MFLKPTGIHHCFKYKVYFLFYLHHLKFHFPYESVLSFVGICYLLLLHLAPCGMSYIVKKVAERLTHTKKMKCRVKKDNKEKENHFDNKSNQLIMSVLG